MDMSWMGWTVPTASFFGAIAAILVFMTIWALLAPQEERVGVLRFATTPGDRLFVSLLGSAFIHLAFLAFSDGPLWWASVVSVAYAAAVFRWV
ncbi:MAG: DUF2160 domain-containing protein [Granulosicoccaceae bacterium]